MRMRASTQWTQCQRSLPSGPDMIRETAHPFELIVKLGEVEREMCLWRYIRLQCDCASARSARQPMKKTFDPL